MNRLPRRYTLGGFRGFAVQSGKGTPLQNLKIEGIKDIIAVASGKGGVGKSTTAVILLGLPLCLKYGFVCDVSICCKFVVNLAVSLANKCQLKVGLLDADVYGPSIPIMMKLRGKPEVSAGGALMALLCILTLFILCWLFQPAKKLTAVSVLYVSSKFLRLPAAYKKMIPIENYGVKCMSMGSLVAEGEAIVMKALEQMTRGVHWGNLDILVVDMPPGTGDAQISISQRLQLSGALIVSTPQDVALMDARRGVKMFSQVNVPILGILENMSYFKCPNCSEPYYIFGKGGAQKTAEEMGMKFLGEVPLETRIRSGSDEGVPVVISNPDSSISHVYSDVAKKVIIRLEELTKEQYLRPEINI
ncbi:UNVERIFIED_CONTAM: Iron-sulfur protein NUBPL [Sesamum indicum]